MPAVSIPPSVVQLDLHKRLCDVFDDALNRIDVTLRLTARLKETLTPEQLKRLKQLELQQQGPHALGRPDIVQELKITQEQLNQFMGVFQDMHKKIEPLMKKAQHGGNPQETRLKAVKIRDDHQGKMEAILTDAQLAQWKDMLGKPFDLGD